MSGKALAAGVDRMHNPRLAPCRSQNLKSDRAEYRAESRTILEPSKSEVTQYRRRIEARETRYLARVAARHDSPGGGVCGTRQEADEDLLGIGAGLARNPKASGGRQPAGMRFLHDFESQSTGKLTHPARQ